jgi:hypothetical protein
MDRTLIAAGVEIPSPSLSPALRLPVMGGNFSPECQRWALLIEAFEAFLSVTL